MWTLHKQSQHCGAQLHVRQPGTAPDEATRDRAAQEHDRADLDVAGGEARPGAYPASPLENGDRARSAPDDTRAAWDDVVQPQRRQPRGDRAGDALPLPEGK